MEADHIIELKDIAINHENGPLLRGVNLTACRGEFIYLIGRSGAGKTSLLRSLYADRTIAGGQAMVCGFDVAGIRPRQIPQLRRRIGIVFQNYRLLDDRNVRGNLEFVLRATGWRKRADIDAQVLKTLDAVGLASKADAAIHSLSEGEQQRVGIARALINTPDLIIADEPTGNLDPVTSAEIVQLLVDLNRDRHTTMLIASHDFMMIDKFPSRMLVCENGTVVEPK